MKKKFEMPVMKLASFMSESVVTSSGNVGKMKKSMENEGHTVTTKSLTQFGFSF